MNDTEEIRIPDNLSPRSKALWTELVPRRARSPERRALLQTALEALDRCDEVRAVVQAEGLTHKTDSTGALHVHPLLRIEKDSRQQFLQAWNSLAFDADKKLDAARTYY